MDRSSSQKKHAWFGLLLREATVVFGVINGWVRETVMGDGERRSAKEKCNGKVRALSFAEIARSLRKISHFLAKTPPRSQNFG